MYSDRLNYLGVEVVVFYLDFKLLFCECKCTLRTFPVGCLSLLVQSDCI